MLTIPVETLTLGLESFALAFALSALLAAPLMALLRKLNAKQTIHTHAPESHQVKEGTPTMGGLIILAGLVPALVVNALKLGPAVYFIVGLVVAFAAIGFIDDYVVPRSGSGKRGLGWAPKLMMQFAAATLAGPALGLSFHPLSWGVLVLFVLFFTNAFNFADGLDGLAGSVGVIFALGLTVVLAIALPLANLGPSMALVGAILPFLFLNAHPAKVFMGDVGALPIGALLGLLVFAPLRDVILPLVDPVGFAAENHPPMPFAPSAAVIPLLVLSIVMIAELVPVPLQVGYFKLTKGKRLFPFTPIHHSFEKKGWPETRVVWSFALVQLLCALVAIYLALRAALPLPATQ